MILILAIAAGAAFFLFKGTAFGATPGKPARGPNEGNPTVTGSRPGMSGDKPVIEPTIQERGDAVNAYTTAVFSNPAEPPTPAQIMPIIPHVNQLMIDLASAGNPTPQRGRKLV
jgi:hypothetical protein